MNSVSQLLLACAGVALLAGCQPDDAVIAVRGKGAATIVISGDASVCERHAAEEFADYVRRIAGVKPVVTNDGVALPDRAVVLGRTKYTASLLGGEPDWAKLGDDGFRVAVRKGRLVIVGSRVRGAQYGAYDVLERFGGVAWLAAKRTIVPRRDVLCVPAATDYTEVPAFRMRDTYWWDAVRDRAFAAHLRLNGERTHLKEEHGGTFGKYDAKLGSCHTFNWLLPSAMYFKDHPEYFSEVKGQRLEHRNQLCLSNPDVLRIVTSNVLARIREAPQADFYGVSQNDWDNHCTCAKCAAIDAEEGSPSGSIIRFVNAVADAVKKEFPTKMVETLAYTYGRVPPKLTKPRDNVLICLCSDNLDRSGALGVSTNKANVAFVKTIAGWGKLTRNIYIWDYTTDFAHYLNAMPNTPYLRTNLQFFRDNGVNFMFEQGDALGEHGDFAELKTYLLAKYMWNPDQSEKPLLDAFFAGYYGAGAPYVRAYYDKVNALPHPHAMGMYESPDASWRSDAFLLEADQLWQKACEATRDDASANFACRMGRAGTVYAILWRNRTKMLTVWCTREPEKYRAEFERMHGYAAFFAQCVKDCPTLCFVENVNRRATTHRLYKTMCAVTMPEKGCDRAEIPAGLFHQTQEWTNYHRDGKTRYEDDKRTQDGKAMWVNPKHTGDAMNFYFGQEAAYDKGATYRLRVRVRVEAEKGAAPTDEVLRVGVYNDKTGNHRKPPRAICVGDAQDARYQWYDVMEWQPRDNDRIFAKPPVGGAKPSVKGVWIDRFEISRKD